ncbi:GDSL esterase/lipase [Striga hermonthica]|uniref:GDSL esterase/lipase n=1 Tax=Striga hermonthica TaxID=68872 RepID=A0A9N7RJN7_STRHE|nr:GDSL esterase/lipase [Striga hermonthica]
MHGQTLSCSTVFKVVCLYLAIQIGTSSAQGWNCPFNYLYHWGDGVTDIGNSIYVLPRITIPAGRKPYGMTYPGYPTGRWSDGLVDFDYSAQDLGLPNIQPYFNMNQSNAANYDGVIFSVARSPVLDRKFFRERNIVIPRYAVSLSQQIRRFKRHLTYVCNSPSECSEWIGNSLALMGDIEGNDIGYALTQGKTIEEVKTYVPVIVKALIDRSREIIKLGAKRMIIPGNGPLGCYPYILTELKSNNPKDYDELGCLATVNNFTVWKNNYLLNAMVTLENEFPDVQILYGDMYTGLRTLIVNSTVIGPDGVNRALKSCCGIGGKYNFDRKRFCGDKGVPVCSNPKDYVFWDGMHYTQEGQMRVEKSLIFDALATLNCTPPDTTVPYLGSWATTYMRASHYLASM